MQSFSDLIAKLGGPALVAPIIGARIDAVRRMSERESVPSQYWQALIDAARVKPVAGVTFASLAKMKPTRRPHTRRDAGAAATTKIDNLSDDANTTCRREWRTPKGEEPSLGGARVEGSCVTAPIKLPPPKRGRPVIAKGAVTARTVEVDQSFIWPRPADVCLDQLQSRASGSLAGLSPKKFRTRQLVEDGVGVLRVWRIK